MATLQTIRNRGGLLVSIVAIYVKNLMFFTVYIIFRGYEDR